MQGFQWTQGLGIRVTGFWSLGVQERVIGHRGYYTGMDGDSSIQSIHYYPLTFQGSRFVGRVVVVLVVLMVAGHTWRVREA